MERVSFVSSIGGAIDYLTGVTGGLLDAAIDSIPLPGIGVLPDVPLGNILEPEAGAERAGANFARSLLESLGVRHAPVDVAKAAASLPLAAQVSCVVPPAEAGAPRTLTLTATAAGADWARADRPSGELAVFVDGGYVGTTRVLVERGGSASVALGCLTAGQHDIELRDATGLTGGNLTRCVTVTSAGVRAETGDAALVARHAPIIEQRDDQRAAHGSDAPLVLSPTIEGNADGTRTIRYYVVLSNEDGGTPVGHLIGQYGRSIDCEEAYDVTVDASGQRLAASYEGPLHRAHAFTGRFEGDRPVLQVATNNNNFTADAHAGSVTRFADAPIAPAAPDPALPRDARIVRSQPWVLAVAGKELLREGKTLAAATIGGVTTLKRVLDPRRYVYLQGVADARGGAVELELAGGRSVRVAVPATAGSGDNASGAIALPDGVDASQVVGLRGAISGALLLDGDWSVRDVPVLRADAASGAAAA